MAVLELTTPRPGVALLTLNRPDRYNAMTVELVGGLHECLDALAVDRAIRVIVLTGAGSGFCGGLDLAGYGEPVNGEGLGKIHAGLQVQRHIASLIPRMRSMPQPIIAAVNGPAAGGGLALVLGSDVRIGAASSKFNVAFIRVGFSGCDIGTSWLLPRIVGVARAQELMLTGRVFDSAEALRIGLLVERVEDDQLLETAYAKANMIIANAPLSVALTKEAMWTALEVPMQAAIDMENRQQVVVGQTLDAREAMKSFAERRAPTYQFR
jgi:enoyl-CoA hydratase